MRHYANLTDENAVDGRDVLSCWTPITDRYVADGGGVEVRYGLSTQADLAWQSVRATDGQSFAYLPGVQDDALYFVKARAFNRLANGAWTAPVLHRVVGKTAAPANVSGLAAAAIPGGVAITVTPSTEVDVITGGFLEVRHGASWAAGTRIFRGPADRVTWPWPAAGSYTLRAKWIDSSGNESASDATLGITVGNGNLIDSASIVPGSVANQSSTLTAGPVSPSTINTALADAQSVASHTLTVTTPNRGVMVGASLSLHGNLAVLASKGYAVLKRGSTEIHRSRASFDSVRWSPMVLGPLIDSPGAGSVTYSVFLEWDIPSGTVGPFLFEAENITISATQLTV